LQKTYHIRKEQKKGTNIWFHWTFIYYNDIEHFSLSVVCSLTKGRCVLSPYPKAGFQALSPANRAGITRLSITWH